MKIHYKSIFNVTEENNKLTILIRSSEEQEDPQDISITPGYYRDAHVLLSNINSTLKDYFKLYDANNETKLRAALTMRQNKSPISYTLTLPPSCSFVIDSKETNSNILSSMLLQTMDRSNLRNITIESNWEFSSPDDIAFIYTNLVKNSIFNNRKSRLLATMPITSEFGYICYEPTNPVYHKLSVNSFINARFEIRDANGKIFNSSFENETQEGPHYPSVITLSVRKSIKD